MKVYILLGQEHEYYGVFGNIDALMHEVDDQRQRDPNGWQYKLQDYRAQYFEVVHVEVQGEVDARS